MTSGVNISATGNVTILGDVVGRDKITIHNPPPLPAREHENRRGLRLLLQAVKAFWIDGVLADATRQAALLALGKELRPEAIDHPWEAVLELPGTSPQSLPRHTNLAERFEQTGRAMLILGEPGSGKAIILLELARDLIARAEHDEAFNQPLPVVFNLSSWSERQPLLEWMAAELAAKYHVPRPIGKAWLEQHRLLPLLDGLDEVRAESRDECVRAINTFATAIGFAGLAVCSRLAEYTALPVRLQLNAAIVLQPLTPEPVDLYLTSAGAEFQPLRASLQADPVMLKLAETPLMLSIMTVAYETGPEGEVVPAATPLESLHSRLFEAYIERTLKRRGQAERACSPEQTRAWLS